MNIKKVATQVALMIEERDAEVYSILIRNKKDKTKPSSITLNEVTSLSFIQGKDVPTYTIKFMGEEVLTSNSLTEAIDATVWHAQEYVDNKAYYNKIRNSI